MEKLTERLRDVLYETINCLSEAQEEIINDALDRLSAYEDTDLEPKDIDALMARSEGLAERLCELTCNQTVAYERLRRLAKADKADEIGVYRFYYCDSEDSYMLGARFDDFYYAHWHDGDFVWDMSRFLPWGETIDGNARGCAWGVHTYPSEPREIGSGEWFKGFLAQRLAEYKVKTASETKPE